MVPIVEEISQSLQDEDGNLPKFYYGPRSFQNMQEGDTFDWLLYMDGPVQYQAYRSTTGFIEEDYKLTLLFAYKSGLDWSYAQHYELIAKAQYAYKRFVAKLVAHADVKDVRKEMTVTELINIFDRGLTGVMVEIRATQINPVKNCS